MCTVYLHQLLTSNLHGGVSIVLLHMFFQIKKKMYMHLFVSLFVAVISCCIVIQNQHEYVIVNMRRCTSLRLVSIV